MSAAVWREAASSPAIVRTQARACSLSSIGGRFIDSEHQPRMAEPGEVRVPVQIRGGGQLDLAPILNLLDRETAGCASDSR